MNGLALFKYKSSILIFHKSLSELRGSQPLWVPNSHTPKLYGRVTFSGPPPLPFGLWVPSVIDPPKSFTHPSLAIIYSSDDNANWRGSRHSRSDFKLKHWFQPGETMFLFPMFNVTTMWHLTLSPNMYPRSYSNKLLTSLCTVSTQEKKRKILDNVTSFISLSPVAKSTLKRALF